MNNVTETLFESLNATISNNPFRTERASEAMYTALNQLNKILLDNDNIADVKDKIHECIDELIYNISLNAFDVGIKTAFKMICV